MPGHPEDVIAQEMARARQRQHPDAGSRTSKASVEPIQTISHFDNISRLPHELLLHIFRATVPPFYQHDPSVIQGPRNLWLTALRTRKALVLTCKAFFGPAVEILYEDIVIRRMGQIPALARTLGPLPTPSGRDVATLVRRLRLDGCVVWAPCAEVVREDLRLILQRCTFLRYFSYHPHPQFPFGNDGSETTSYDGFNPSWLFLPDPDCDSVGGSLRERLTTSLRTFDLAVELTEDALVQLHWFLSAATPLTVLKLGRVLQQEYTHHLLGLPTLHFPALEELQVYVTHTSFQYYICQRWEMPALRVLTATGCQEFPECLLRAHGRKLTYFHMRHHHEYAWEVPRLECLQRLGALCPLIEHLVIPTWLKEPLVINSPTLRFVDVWGYHPPPYIVRQGWYHICRTSALPSIHRVRILTTMPRHGWESSLSFDWPRICHPTAVTGDAQRVYAFPGVRVVQTAWGVLHDYQDDDLKWSSEGGRERRDNSGLYEDEGDDDRTSVVSEDTDWEGPASWDVVEEVDTLLGRLPRGALEQLGRDVVLEMFHDSTEREFLLGDE